MVTDLQVVSAQLARVALHELGLFFVLGVPGEQEAALPIGHGDDQRIVVGAAVRRERGAGPSTLSCAPPK